MKRQKMSKPARKELADALRDRYRRGGRLEKTRILDEFVAASGYNRQYAMALLGRSPATPSLSSQPSRERRCVYAASTFKALEMVWALSGYLCSKRLVPFLPEFLLALERCGELCLDAFTRNQLLRLSPATMDRHLASVRRSRGQRGIAATRPGSLLKSQIPIRTFADWEDAIPGFCEVDLVVHINDTQGGDYLCTLTLTDVCTGWTECRPLMHKGQMVVAAALRDMRARLPYPLLGIDSDNGSEFINDSVLRFCQKRKITFTRGRPRNKNDQCRVEQKNGHIVRSLVGYDRYQGVVAFRRLNALYHYAGLWVNFFQPSQKLIEKTRDGARVTKSYDEAKTPYQRALDSDTVSTENKQALRDLYIDLNPVTLLRQVREAQHRLRLTNYQSQIPK